MARLVRITYLLVTLFTLSSRALQVTPGSSCASFCLDDKIGDSLNPQDSNTVPASIVCNDVDFWSNTTGTKFRNCINCLQTSSAVNGTENDVSWYLYNLRYSLGVCLFSFPNASTTDTVSSPCSLDSTCLPLQASLETGILDTSNNTEYQYCSKDNGAFGGTNIDNCVQCLQATNEQTYLSNFVTALSAGCQQEPSAGVLLGLNGTLFSKTAISVTSPASNQTSTSTTAKDKHLSAGAITGIAIGAALLLASGIGLFIFHWRRQRRYSEFQDERRSSIQSYSIKIENTISAPVSTDDGSAPGQRFVGPQYAAEMYDRKLPLRSTPSEASLGISRHPFGMSHHRPASLAPIQIPPPSRSQNWVSTSQKLKDLPAHPAYIPRSLARPSRALEKDEEAARQKSAKVDSYAIQRYLEAAEESANLALQHPPPSSSKFASPRSFMTHKTTRTEASVTVISPPPVSILSGSVASPPPMSISSPPAPPSRRGTPALRAPSLSRFRGPKKYTPPGVHGEEPAGGAESQLFD